MKDGKRENLFSELENNSPILCEASTFIFQPSCFCILALYKDESVWLVFLGCPVVNVGLTMGFVSLLKAKMPTLEFCLIEREVKEAGPKLRELHSIEGTIKSFVDKFGVNPLIKHIVGSKKYTDLLWVSTLKRGARPLAPWEASQTAMKTPALASEKLNSEKLEEIKNVGKSSRKTRKFV